MHKLVPRLKCHGTGAQALAFLQTLNVATRSAPMRYIETLPLSEPTLTQAIQHLPTDNMTSVILFL